MRWKVTGANPSTGREITREVDAMSSAEAEALANAKGMLVSSVEPVIQTCENCGRTIGKLETACLHDDHVVCAECKQRLAPEKIGDESVVETIEPADVLAEIVQRREAKYAGGLMPKQSPPLLPSRAPCPNCGSNAAPTKKAKGSFTVGCLLMLLIFPIGLIYCIMYSGSVYACPSCGVKRGDVA